MMPSEVVLPTVAVADDDDNNDGSPLIDQVNDKNHEIKDSEDPVASLLGMSDNAEVDVPVTVNSSMPIAPSDHSTPNQDDGSSHSDENIQSVSGNHQHQGICSTTTTNSNNNNNVNKTVTQKSSSLPVSPPLQTTTSTAPPPPSSSILQQLQIENHTLREKNDKLKSLLGRSAKAQRDAKHELERTKRLYESIKLENEKLGKRVEALANRPTHMDLLADFEANFDRALLSIGNNTGGNNNSGQSGGENAAESSSSSPNEDTTFSSNDDTTTSATTPLGTTTDTHLFLLAEIDEATSRIANLESINVALQHRYDELEKSLAKERKSLNDTCATLRLELRGTKSDSEKWERECRMALATMKEMHLEVDLATKAAAEANRRASYAELGMRLGGGTMISSSSSMRVSSGAARGEGGGSQQADSDYVAGLEAKVAALQEWALASAESKRLTAERCMELEERVRELEGQDRLLFRDGEDCSSTLLTSSDLETFDHEGCSVSNTVVENADSSAGNLALVRERKLWTKSSSLVVGAGMVGHAILELGPVFVEPSERVLLRWKFDITPAGLDIDFSVLKGMCEARARRGADACLRVRRVMGGGGGDVGGAFARQNACTMVWSNEMSWVWPRTVKWTAEAVAISWGD